MNKTALFIFISILISAIPCTVYSDRSTGGDPVKNNDQKRDTESLNRNFLIAVKDADFSKVKDLVKQGADINAKVRDCGSKGTLLTY